MQADEGRLPREEPGPAAALRGGARADRQIGRVTFEHVRREFNKDADRLANEAMDEAARTLITPAIRPAFSFSARYDVSTSRCIAVHSPT